MTTTPRELLQGTLDLLILKVLSTGPMHGWDIARRVQAVSNDRLKLRQGSLYPALHRLEARAWVAAEWGVSEAGRAARFYRLTARGRRQLETEKGRWLSFVEAMGSVLGLEESS